jgi:hypothetical protein
MESDWAGVLGLIFEFAVLLGIAVWQLWSLGRDRRETEKRREAEAGRQQPGED